MRGDGPKQYLTEVSGIQFSPHAWGWSAFLGDLRDWNPVLPTCVGMVRASLTCQRWALSSPHMRGDGPRRRWLAIQRMGFSPHAWGWSAASRCCSGMAGVLPTCVGMVRRNWHSADSFSGSPHMRGDGPYWVDNAQDPEEFSPNTQELWTL